MIMEQKTNPNKGNAMRDLNNEPVVAEKRTGLSGNSYEIIKDRFVVSRPWYSTVTAEDGFYIKAGPYRTKKGDTANSHLGGTLPSTNTCHVPKLTNLPHLNQRKQ